VIADGLGTSLDETVAEFMIFFAVGCGVAASLQFGKKRRGAAGALVLAALAVGALAFVLPQRYLRPRIAKIRPASAAAVRIVSPVPDQQVRGRELRITFELAGGRLIERATTRLRPDEGHLHLSLDGQLIGTSFGLVHDLPVGDLQPGPHTLKAEYVAGDHGPFAPRVIATVRFELVR
jgi:hypothetical protein